MKVHWIRLFYMNKMLAQCPLISSTELQMSYLHSISEAVSKLASSIIKSVPPKIDPEYGDISTQYSL